MSAMTNVLPPETGWLAGALGVLGGLFAWLKLRAQRDVEGQKALVDRITRLEAREATHEKQLDDLRSRATTAEQQVAQLTWQLQDAQADLVKAQGDLVTMSGEVSRRDQRIEQLEGLLRGYWKELRGLRRDLGQGMPSEPPPLKLG